VLRRLGVQAIRYGIPYIPTDDPEYPRWRKEFDSLDEAPARQQHHRTADGGHGTPRADRWAGPPASR
jgi:hypothetical protein